MENNLDPEPIRTEPDPKIIGLTGGIGSGKSTVAKYIEKQGFPIYYSDIRAKEIVNENEFLKENIIGLLGSEAYDKDGFYNRKYVAEKIFNDDNLLKAINDTIHPAVKNDFQNWLHKQNSPFIFKETALLFELKLHLQCYKSVLVTADENLRMKRVMDRDGKTYREIEAIMKKQMLEKEKCKLADYIIYNNSDIDHLKTETLNVISMLQKD